MHFLMAHSLYVMTGVCSGFIGYAYGAFIKSEVMAEYAKLKAATLALK